ncbi:unnamed protein product [Amoebophrya sp. A120]|nr:unnamed protein product [Amoebophrya sp. A120]|eukprot:GSA120T00012244001.1
MLRAFISALWRLLVRAWDLWKRLVLKNQIINTLLLATLSTCVFTVATLVLFWFAYNVFVPGDLVLPLHATYSSSVDEPAGGASGPQQVTRGVQAASTTPSSSSTSSGRVCAEFGFLDQKEPFQAPIIAATKIPSATGGAASEGWSSTSSDESAMEEREIASATVEEQEVIDKTFYSQGFEKTVFSTVSSSFLRFTSRTLTKAKSVFRLRLAARLPPINSARNFNDELGPIGVALTLLSSTQAIKHSSGGTSAVNDSATKANKAASSKKEKDKEAKNVHSSPIVPQRKTLSRRSFFVPATSDPNAQSVFSFLILNPLRMVLSRLLHADQDPYWDSDFHISLAENFSLKSVLPSDRLELCLSPAVRMENLFLILEPELDGFKRWIRMYPYLFALTALAVAFTIGCGVTLFLFILSSTVLQEDVENEETELDESALEGGGAASNYNGTGNNNYGDEQNGKNANGRSSEVDINPSQHSSPTCSTTRSPNNAGFGHNTTRTRLVQSPGAAGGGLDSPTSSPASSMVKNRKKNGGGGQFNLDSSPVNNQQSNSGAGLFSDTTASPMSEKNLASGRVSVDTNDGTAPRRRKNKRSSNNQADANTVRHLANQNSSQA